MNAPKGAGENVLYLDYDGVLHHESCYWHARKGPYLNVPEGENNVLFRHAPLLAEMLEPYPDLKIVLSTSWVGLTDALVLRSACLAHCALG